MYAFQNDRAERKKLDEKRAPAISFHLCEILENTVTVVVLVFIHLVLKLHECMQFIMYRLPLNKAIKIKVMHQSITLVY